jgi:hypothetical protein
MIKGRCQDKDQAFRTINTILAVRTCSSIFGTPCGILIEPEVTTPGILKKPVPDLPRLHPPVDPGEIEKNIINPHFQFLSFKE